MAAAVILKNRKNAISRPQFYRFRWNLARWRSLTLLTVSTVKNLKFQKSKMAAAEILKNRKIAIFRPRFNRYWRNLARWCISNLLTVLTVKNLKFYKSKMAAAAILKIVKWPYLSRGLSDFDEFWPDDVVQHSWPLQSLKIWNYENPRWRRPPSWIIKIIICRPYVGRDWSDLV